MIVFHEHDRLRVTDWVPLQADQIGLQLLVLIDERATMSIGLQFDDLRQFMSAQPPTTLISVGYMRNGTVEIVQNFTRDHALASKVLRLPIVFPGVMSSPYLSLTDVMKRWRESTQGREIFMISDGIDRCSRD